MQRSGKQLASFFRMRHPLCKLAMLRVGGIRTGACGLLWIAAGMVLANSAFGQSGGQVLYNGIALPQQWPPSQTVTQTYQIPSYITNPPALIPIDTGRQLFVDDFLIQQTTLTRTQHRPVMHPANPIIVPDALDLGLNAIPFSGGAWFDPSDQLFKMWLFCGTDPAKVCYAYSVDGKSWIRPSIPDAFIPNTDQVMQNGMVVWMDLQDPNPAQKFKLFTWDTAQTGVSYSPDGIHWTATSLSWPLVYDRSTLFWNPFRRIWVDSMKNYTTAPSTLTRAAYLSRLHNYSESADLITWTPAEPSNFSTSFWTGPDVNDPPYYAGGTLPQLYNLDAVAYESVIVGLFSWFYGGFGDADLDNSPGPDLVELGVGFSRDGFQWVRPTRGAGTGPNGAFIPASNTPGTWNQGNTQSAGGCFLVVGDELWFYFSGRSGLHNTPWPNITGSTGLATLRRDGFYSMNAGSTAGVLTTRPVQFAGKYLFVNVNDPQGSLQVQVLNPGTGTVLATSLPLSANKTLQQVSWANGLSDLSAFANQPVQFQFTLTNGELYSFWASASASGASNGYVAAGGPGFNRVTDNAGSAAYPTTVSTPEIYPLSTLVSSLTNISILSRTVGSTIHYTLDGSQPTVSSPVYNGPFNLAASATIKAFASAPGLTASPVASVSFTVDNTPPSVSITAPVNGQTVAAIINLTAAASDGLAGISSVQFLADGVPLGAVRAAPYALPFQTTALTNTTHQITAIATNGVGLQATSAPVTITVQNVGFGPATGLAGYWSFDTTYTNGATAYDQSGNNNNATANATIGALGAAGLALQFNGFSSYAQAGSTSTQLYDLVGDLSLSLWVQTANSSRNEALVGKYASAGSGSGSGYVLATTPSGTAQLFLGLANVTSGANVATDVTKINDGQWHQLTAVISLGNSVTFYVDGVQSSTQPIKSAANAANAILEIGLSPSSAIGTYFTGSIDDVRIYNRALSSSEVLSLSNIVAPNPPSASALFVKSDTVTQGNWKGKFGQDGFFIANDSTNPASYASVNFSGSSLYTWAASTTDSRALFKGASTSDRIASTFYASAGFTIDVNLTDGQPHQIALYLLDWDLGQRTETISVVRAGSGALLDSRSVSNFTNGQYLVWNLSGHVLINAIYTAGPNAVVNGVFLQPPGGPDLVVAKTHAGNFAPGDQNGDTYTLTVSNAGGAPTTGIVTVTDSLPAGITATSIAGNGWSCTQPGGPCTRSDALNAGANYPRITLAVSVANIAPVTLVNKATVAGGGEADTTNDSVQDPTSIQWPSTSAFLTGGVSGASLRNNFSGWVGMKLTIGAKPVVVLSLGRLCSAGNSGTHVVKVVNAANGSDVPNGSASLNMAGCVTGQYLYATLGPSIILQANTPYYLVTQELSGGDLWYDRGTILPASDAAVPASVYSFDSSNWILASAANTSYVSPNFLYSVVLPPTITATVQSNPSTAAFSVDGNTYTSPQSFKWISGSPHALSVASPQSAGSGAQDVWSAWSDGGTASHSVSPTADTTFTANFLMGYLLTTSVSPPLGGSIAASPASATGYYNNGASVQLTANPAPGCAFSSWSGGFSGNNNPLSFTISAVTNVTANFQCSAPSGTSLVTAYALNGPALRNNFSGWVGMKFTVGVNALNVTVLGRISVIGNSGTHIVKIVRASDGGDVPGGSAAVSMAAGTAGQFNYAALAAPIVLAANTAYYLVTQELSGGDKWYDFGNILSSADVAVNNSVYSSDSIGWIPIGSRNSSYVPPTLLYSVVTPVPIAVTVQSNPVGESFSVDGTAYNSAQVFNWTSGSPHTIATASPQSAGTGAQIVWTGWTDGGAISHGVAPASATTFTANFALQYLLNGSITPAGAGSLSYGPISATGYFASGTSVQVTALANPGCTFSNWSGDLSSSANPQSITMLAPHSVTANFQCDSTPTTSTNFMTGFAPSGQGLRNDFSGWVGTAFTLGANPLMVSSLGRFCVAGNSGTHLVKLVYAGVGTDVPGGSASVSMAGCTAGQFVYSNLPAPVTLPANASYYLVTQELAGGDQWYNHGAVSTTSAASISSSVYSSGSSWIRIDSRNTSFTPPDFVYTMLAPAPARTFIVDFNLNNSSLRNDFTGFVGTKLVLGASPVTVVSIGRICALANSATHTVELVAASTGAVVPGSATSVNMSGCIPGTFVYVALSVPITLLPNTAYYLVSQESAGGDRWYDYGTIVTTNAATISSSEYMLGSSWFAAGTVSTSYVPLNFQYQ